MPEIKELFRGQIPDSDRELIVRRLAPLLGSGIRLCLFGSRARGNAGARADIDLALVAKNNLSADLLARVRETLEEAPIPFRTDVVDYHSAPPDLQRAIDQEGVEWIA